MELVAKESVYSLIDGYYKKQGENERACACIDIWAGIKALPAAAVRPVVRAHWIQNEHPELDRCSSCNQWVLRNELFIFCPKCGAVMDAD